MNTKLVPEDFDLPPESEEEVYTLLLRALQRKQGFGLFFVQYENKQDCQKVLNILHDFPEKHVEILEIGPDSKTVYDRIENRWQQQSFDILIIDGLEKALHEYEQELKSQWSSKEIYSYSWKGVAPILSHLNQIRDKLRNNFPVSFVFLVPNYAVTYLLERAADFFDWRSGLFIFPPSSQEENHDFFAAKSHDQYQAMSLSEWQQEVAQLKIKIASTDTQNTLDEVNTAYELGLAYYAKQYYENAIIYWAQVLDLDPKHVNALYSRGLAMKRLGRLQEAIESYSTALEIQPNYPEVYNNRGLARQSLKDTEGAIADYTQAIKQNPDYAAAYNNRGIAHRDSGDLDAAIADYSSAIKLKPDYAIAHYNRGNAYRQMEKNMSAQDDYATAHYNRGNAHRQIEKNMSAQADYTQAIKIQPDNADFYNNRGIANHDLKEYQAAINDYNQALHLRPDFASAYLGRGMAYSALEDFESAIADYDQALKLKPNDAEIQRHRELAQQQTPTSPTAIPTAKAAPPYD